MVCFRPYHLPVDIAQMGFTSIGGHNVDGFAASDSRLGKSTKSATVTAKHPYQLPVVPGFAVPTPVKAKKMGSSTMSASTGSCHFALV